MNKLRKFFLILIVFTLALSGVAFAADDGRWMLVDKNKWNEGYYIDKQTVTYDSNKNIGTYWMKKQGPKDNAGTYNLDKVKLDFNDKTQQLMVAGRVVNYNVDHQFSCETTAPVLYIAPDSISEKAANYIASQNGIENIYTISKDRWKWIYSTDYLTVSMCKDGAVYDNASNTYIAWVKMKNIVEPGLEDYRTLCHIDNKIIGVKNCVTIDEILTRTVMPGSNDEKLFNAALVQFRNDEMLSE